MKNKSSKTDAKMCIFKNLNTLDFCRYHDVCSFAAVHKNIYAYENKILNNLCFSNVVRNCNC